MLMQFTAKRFASLSSCSRSRKEFFEVSNVALKSSNQWCWRFAAVSSDSFSSQGRKKVTKQERSTMVLAFVEKYRALNGGKFPTVSCTKKQVGGSYYVVREIFQELQHNHNKAPLETKKEFKIREEHAKCQDFSLTKETCILADTKKKSFKEFVGGTAEVRKQHLSNKSKGGTKTSNLMSIGAHSDNQVEVDAHRHLTLSRFSEGSQQDNGLGFDKLHVPASPATVKPQTHTSGTPNAQVLNVGHQMSSKLETKTSILHSSIEERKVCRKNASSASNLHEEALISEELYNGQRQTVEQGKPSTRSNFWGNLKSITVGIINIWKK